MLSEEFPVGLIILNVIFGLTFSVLASLLVKNKWKIKCSILFLFIMLSDRHSLGTRLVIQVYLLSW